MAGDQTTWLAIAMVAAVAFASRLAGPMLMARIGVSPRIERFLDGLSTSVIAALVASIIAGSGPREGAAVLIAALVMLATKSAVWAMVAGMAVAALWTFLAGG